MGDGNGRVAVGRGVRVVGGSVAVGIGVFDGVSVGMSVGAGVSVGVSVGSGVEVFVVTGVWVWAGCGVTVASS